MYKQQKPLTISSGLWALFVTAVVLLVAASANAQTSDDRGNTSSSAPTNAEVMPKRDQVESAREVRPAPATTAPVPGLRPMPANATTTRGETMEVRKAELATRAALMQEKRATLEQKTAERKTLLEQRREAIASSTLARKASLAEQVQDKVRSMSLRVANQLSTAITKLEEVSDRLRTRANDLSSRGVDVTTVISTLDQANASLSAAKRALEGIDVNIEYTVSSERPTEIWTGTRAQFQEVHAMIKEVRELLREALAEMKEAVRAAGTDRGVSAAVQADAAVSDE